MRNSAPKGATGGWESHVVKMFEVIFLKCRSKQSVPEAIRGRGSPLPHPTKGQSDLIKVWPGVCRGDSGTPMYRRREVDPLAPGFGAQRGPKGAFVDKFECARLYAPIGAGFESVPLGRYPL